MIGCCVISPAYNMKLNGCVIDSFILYINGIIEIMPWNFVCIVNAWTVVAAFVVAIFRLLSGCSRRSAIEIHGIAEWRTNVYRREGDGMGVARARARVCVWFEQRLSSWLVGVRTCCELTAKAHNAKYKREQRGHWKNAIMYLVADVRVWNWRIALNVVWLVPYISCIRRSSIECLNYIHCLKAVDLVRCVILNVHFATVQITIGNYA